MTRSGLQLGAVAVKKNKIVLIKSVGSCSKTFYEKLRKLKKYMCQMKRSAQKTQCHVDLLIVFGHLCCASVIGWLFCAALLKRELLLNPLALELDTYSLAHHYCTM